MGAEDDHSRAQKNSFDLDRLFPEAKIEAGKGEKSHGRMVMNLNVVLLLGAAALTVVVWLLILLFGAVLGVYFRARRIALGC